ncbi:MAG: tetratricopeptide repeat protein [Flavobacterium sp.]|nr:tetratricopeptide repeat protein [Flavobacterium sp.]
MKKIVYLLILITQVFFAQTGLENGNTLYKQGNYQEAINVYETIIFRSQKQSPELYFNTANCYYKLNKVGPSIYNYEKALLLNPEFEAAKNNLEIARKLQIDDIKVIEKVGIGKIIENLTSKLNYDTWAWISVGFAMLFLLFFVGYYFSQTSLIKRLLFSGMLLVLALVLITLTVAISEKYQSEQKKPAIIFAEVTSLLSQPKLSGKEIMKLHEGTKVFVLFTEKSFTKVQLTDSKMGWIATNAIKELKK